MVQRRQSAAELHAKQLLAKPLSSSTNSDGALAKVQAMTIQFNGNANANASMDEVV